VPADESKTMKEKICRWFGRKEIERERRSVNPIVNWVQSKLE